MEERRPKRHKQEQENPSTMTDTVEIQTILSIQELDDVLFESFRNLPTSTTSLIDFVEDAFDEFRRTLFTIEEIHEFYDKVDSDDREPYIHFMDDPDYLTVGEGNDDEERTPTYSWDWSSNSMVEKK